jgi:cyclophilin family peptidyl-prolyl cis-trans isomerase
MILMNRVGILSTALVLAFFAAVAPTGLFAQESGNPVVVIETTEGNITVELLKDKAPITVENFLAYVEADFYRGTIFHRVIKGFMIQGGGFKQDMSRKETRPPIKNEAKNGVSNKRGTLAMARTGVVDSATSQFFINTVDNGNRGLDYRSDKPAEYGYAVFGKVTGGMGIVDRIEDVQTGIKMGHQNVPLQPVVIKAVRIKK